MMALCEELGLQGAYAPVSKIAEETRGTRMCTLASLALDTIPNDPTAPTRLKARHIDVYYDSLNFLLITNLTLFFNVFISLLYMFRATLCSSSGGSIVSIHHLVYITLCRWPPGMQARDLFRATLCSSSGGSIVSIHHLVYITLCRWPPGMQVRDLFRATLCSSSGGSIVSIHHLIYITLCRWPPGMQVRDLHTRRPPTQSDIYQMMY